METTPWLDGLFLRIRDSRVAMEPFRKNYFAFVKQFVGHNHSEAGEADRVALNLIKQDILSYLRILASHNPRMMVSTRYPQLKWLAGDMEAWGNWRLVEMDFERTLRRCTQNALFQIGIGTVGVTYRQTYEGETHAFMEPFFDSVDLDDYFHDMEAKSIETLDFQGHRFKMLLADVQSDESFDPQRRAEIQPAQHRRTNENGEDRIKNIEANRASFASDEFAPYVELCQIWLPREQLILTCEWGEQGPMGAPLRASKWHGPSCGMYHLLGFAEVPGNTMFASPISDRYDLALLINRQFNKASRQSNNAKSVLAYQGTAESDAKNVQKASDGQLVRVNHIDQMKEVGFRGADAAEFQVMMQNIGLYDRFAGNLATIAGLSAQAPTLGQEELLQSNSSAQIKDMQEAVVKFARNVIRSLCWYWMNDNQQTYEGERSLEGIDQAAPIQITPEDRLGNFMLLNFDIEPYSLQGQTPQQKNQQIDALLQQIILPLAPMLAQQGIFPNMQSILRLKSKYMGMTDLGDILTFVEPQVQEEPYAEPPKMPNATTRTNVRVNRSEKTPQGQAEVGMQNAQAMQAEPRVAL
jgi:hypothetical protein